MDAPAGGGAGENGCWFGSTALHVLGTGEADAFYWLMVDANSTKILKIEMVPKKDKTHLLQQPTSLQPPQPNLHIPLAPPLR